MEKIALAVTFALNCNVAAAATVTEFKFPIDQATLTPIVAGIGPLVSGYGETPYVGDALTNYVLSIDALGGYANVTSEAEQSRNGEGNPSASPQTTDATSSSDARGASSSAAVQFGNMTFEGSGGGGQAKEQTAEGAVVVLSEDKTGRQTLNFDDQHLRLNDGVSTLKVGPATITNLSGGDLFIYHSDYYGMPDGGGFCALGIDFTCTGDISIVFEEPITDLIFSGFFALSSDAVYVQLFNGVDLVYEGLFAGNDTDETILFDFTGLTLTSIFLYDDSSLESKGIAYGGFEFDYATGVPPVAVVPLPASLSLLLGSLAVLFPAGMSNRQRRRMRSTTQRLI